MRTRSLRIGFAPGSAGFVGASARLARIVGASSNGTLTTSFVAVAVATSTTRGVQWTHARIHCNDIATSTLENVDRSVELASTLHRVVKWRCDADANLSAASSIGAW